MKKSKKIKSTKQATETTRKIGRFGRLGEIREFGEIFKKYLQGVFRRLKMFWVNLTRNIKDFLFYYLPRIYRFFTARIIIILGTIYIIYNLVPLPYPYISFASFKNNYQAHLLLGETFLIKNNLEEAKNEFALAYPLTKNKNEINERLSEVNNLIKEKINLEAQLTFWEKQIEEKANYRDAYLEMALLNYQTKRPALARFYFEKAKDLDPNNVMVKEMEGMMR